MPPPVNGSAAKSYVMRMFSYLASAPVSLMVGGGGGGGGGGTPDLWTWWQTLRLKFGRWSADLADRVLRGLDLLLAVLDLPLQVFCVVYMISYQVNVLLKVAVSRDLFS